MILQRDLELIRQPMYLGIGFEYKLFQRDKYVKSMYSTKEYMNSLVNITPDGQAVSIKMVETVGDISKADLEDYNTFFVQVTIKD